MVLGARGSVLVNLVKSGNNNQSPSQLFFCFTRQGAREAETSNVTSYRRRILYYFVRSQAYPIGIRMDKSSSSKILRLRRKLNLYDPSSGINMLIMVIYFLYYIALFILPIAFSGDVYELDHGSSHSAQTLSIVTRPPASST